MQEKYFRSLKGKERAVKISKDSKPIQGGSYGDIFNAETKFHGERGEHIIKEYVVPSQAVKSLENYARARKAGLKVFDVYKLERNGKTILMSDGRAKNKICIGSNSRLTLEGLGYPKIKEIKNFKEFLKSYFSQAIRAAEKGISVHLDVPFFILDKPNLDSLDFVLGDLDNLERSEEVWPNSGKDTAETIVNRDIKHNIFNLQNALVEFLYANVDEEVLKEYLKESGLYLKTELKYDRSQYDQA
jgi:hypothetical protein